MSVPLSVRLCRRFFLSLGANYGITSMFRTVISDVVRKKMFRFQTIFRNTSVIRTAISDVSDATEIPMFRTATVNHTRTRTRTNTNPIDTEANAAGRSGNARALRKQSKCGVIHEGEGHWPKFSQKL